MLETDQLAIEQERTKRAQLRNDRLKLLISRNGLLLGAWLVIGVVSCTLVIFGGDETVRWGLGVISGLGFLLTIAVLELVRE